MAKFLQLVSGVPKMVEVVGSSTVAIYDETYTATGTVMAGSPITLPLGGTYTNSELQVWLNGMWLNDGEDFNYLGSPPRTAISLASENLVAGDLIRFRIDTDPDVYAVYDETYTVSGTITTGTPVTLPLSGQYVNEELEVWLNGQRLESVLDYNYVGASPPRTQVSFTFDLINGDKINFRVDRAAP